MTVVGGGRYRRFTVGGDGAHCVARPDGRMKRGRRRVRRFGLQLGAVRRHAEPPQLRLMLLRLLLMTRVGIFRLCLVVAIPVPVRLRLMLMLMIEDERGPVALLPLQLVIGRRRWRKGASGRTGLGTHIYTVFHKIDREIRGLRGAE
jgi:hypothetical protein